MINLKTERIAVHNCASIFSDFGWIFREQSIGDFGIDAIVETQSNCSPSGKLIALQIKGGNSNFYQTKSSLIFYFSHSHYLYWKNYSLPVFLILHDSNNTIYWQLFSKKNIKKTRTRWKLIIPKTNLLKDSKLQIDKISEKKAIKRKKNLRKVKTTKKNRDFIYFLGDKNSLCLSINKEKYQMSFDFNYNPRNNGNYKLKKLNNDDPFYSTLKNFEKIINKKIYSKEKNLELSLLKIIGGNIEFLRSNIWNRENYSNNIPSYEDFMLAFERYSGLKKSEYQTNISDGFIYIYSEDDKTFEIHTLESRQKQIQNFILMSDFEFIKVFTSFSAWSEIYMDYGGIHKHNFIPLFLNIWDYYWNNEYEMSKKLNTPTNNIDELKNSYRKKYKEFKKLYNKSENIIELSFDFSFDFFYPASIIVMYQVFGEEILSLYSGIELSEEDWVEVDISQTENWEYEPSFFIRQQNT
ncbi:DUF4365 domain-containing protein [Polaribacter porphyrae]|uniref:DUF4365 domain-containing protein n=1 Tax=Polaribacter porphyrae TaxID=1137780 RepID=A0A2S7WQG6_9FLAO|nr:DUF4365 domain-containing protein [Polaribacter porphyrae]PQJ79511.1 hypothetical protein BTO18_10155 [Polaribacter porphyrae]